jgi:hypothetical protein
MTTSYNGWPADEHLATRPLVVNGVAFAPGVRDDDDVETVFRYIAEQWAEHVEPLVSPGCWGFSFRPNRNDPTELSCHSSATAIDINAPQHPNGIEAWHNMSATQIAAVHEILASVDELAELVHWGGDWHAPSLTPDPMHFELHNFDRAMLARVADRIRNGSDDMPYTPKQLTQIIEAAIEPLGDRLTELETEIKETLHAVRSNFRNVRVILKGRFDLTDADLDELLGKQDDDPA